MTLEELFNEVEEASEDPALASIFLENLKRAMDKNNPSGWQRVEIDPTRLQELKALVEIEFMETCDIFEIVDDDPIYKEATEIAGLLCRILNERLNAGLVPPRIVSSG